MNLRCAAVVAAILAVAACSDSAKPTSPTTTSSGLSPAGNWAGSITDAISGDGTLQLTLTERAPTSLTGTWSATFQNGDRFLGPATAGLSAPTGYGIMLYVDPQPSCTGPGGCGPPLGFTLVSVVVTSNRLTAVVGRTSCSGISFGAVSLSRQW